MKLLQESRIWTSDFEIVSKIQDLDFIFLNYFKKQLFGNPSPVKLSLGTKWDLKMVITQAEERLPNGKIDTMLPGMSPKAPIDPKDAKSC